MQDSLRQSSGSIARYRYLDVTTTMRRRSELAAGALIEIAGLFVLVSLLWGLIVFTAFTASLP